MSKLYVLDTAIKWYLVHPHLRNIHYFPLQFAVGLLNPSIIEGIQHCRQQQYSIYASCEKARLANVMQEIINNRQVLYIIKQMSFCRPKIKHFFLQDLWCLIKICAYSVSLIGHVSQHQDLVLKCIEAMLDRSASRILCAHCSTELGSDITGNVINLTIYWFKIVTTAGWCFHYAINITILCRILDELKEACGGQLEDSDSAEEETGSSGERRGSINATLLRDEDVSKVTGTFVQCHTTVSMDDCGIMPLYYAAKLTMNENVLLNMSMQYTKTCVLQT